MDPTTLFTTLRPRLQRIAYRMLGSVADAEDVVQDAWLRWHGADHEEVLQPDAWLVRTVTRLCLDVLKSARIKREDYIGPWLPEPFIDPDNEDDDITLPLMLAMERLSPLERAAFLLHDVFELDFNEVGEAIGRESAAARQLASRARTRVQDARPRFPVSREQQQDIASAFFAASRSGNVGQLKQLLADKVVFYGDGGGKRNSAVNPIFGLDKVARLLEALAHKAGWDTAQVLCDTRIDGLPGQVSVENDAMLQTIALEIDGGKITGIYVTRNPDKLCHLERATLQRISDA
ncbi:sigma-70 family RNA polymerase sigma factor [Massilia yuzhufengensis]|uniref:RNA polymerase sigma-70 factor, ECF subfamily n=1 Tax=Massilia yuzhufengensis TaxID=1164594 RepID=A0A1I1U8T8_9BURK|nr:sigma-70 family RNA polymerase sigma factor [Massilia yuzhufengensis]SFD65988.1 RNA polymerase sigma-70 factor, ECF subfamily [Massilia yuzhufengensis]